MTEEVVKQVESSIVDEKLEDDKQVEKSATLSTEQLSQENKSTVDVKESEKPEEVKQESQEDKTVLSDDKSEKIEEVKQDESEKLSEDIKATKEEIAIIKEAREEIVSLYAQNRELKSLSEKLSKDNEKLLKELESLRLDNAKLSESLSSYVKIEKENQEKLRLERLEKLSLKFKQLGQEKTVEQLASKDDAVLMEFEMLVDAALAKVAETKEMPSTTIPSDTVAKESLESKVDKKVEVVVPKNEKSKKPDMFTNILQTLASEQNTINRKVKIF